MQERFLTRENIPCWYELSYQAEPIPTIEIRLHKQWTSQFKIVPGAPIVEYYLRTFGFRQFHSNYEQDFGFDAALKFSGQSGNFSCLLVPLPQIRQLDSEKCHRCGDYEKEGLPFETCLCCGGSGKTYSYVLTQAHAISATLSVLTRLLFFQQETDSSLSQLMTLETICQPDLQGGSLQGEYSIPVRQWLRNHGVGHIEHVEQAMRSAWSYMMGGMSTNRTHLYAQVAYSKGWLNMSCDGDACTLNPDGYIQDDSFGYAFSSHNVDTALQQLTFVAGLAKLHDLVRQSEI